MDTTIETLTAARDEARATARAAERREYEADLALADAMHLDTPHTRWMRAFLAGDEKAIRRARIEADADAFLRYGWAPSRDIADEVTSEIARRQVAQAESRDLLHSLGVEVHAEPPVPVVEKCVGCGAPTLVGDKCLTCETAVEAA